MNLPPNLSRQSADVIFFLGAGASVYAGVPALQQMTKEFAEHLKSKENKRDIGSLYNFLVDKIKLQSKKEPNFEEVLGLLYQLTDITGRDKPTLSSFIVLDPELKDKESLLDQLRLELEAFIREQALKPNQYTVSNYLSPLLSQNWARPIEIFSVNYDICVELLCKASQWKIIDGFDPEWNPNLLRSAKNPADHAKTAFLHKLHGSALWYRSEEGLLVKSHIRPDPQKPEVQLFDGRKADQLLLYPAFKQPKETPFLDLAQNLREQLSQKKFVIVIGYAFGDDYLKHLFRDAFISNPAVHMILIDPNARGIYGKLIEDPAFKNAFENRVSCCPFKAEKFLRDFAQLGFEQWARTLNAFSERDTAERTSGQMNWEDFLRPSGALDQNIDLDLGFRIYEKARARPAEKKEFLYLTVKNFALAIANGIDVSKSDYYAQYKHVATAMWQHFNLTLKSSADSNPARIDCPDIFGYEQSFIEPTKRFLEKLVSWSDNDPKLVNLNQRFLMLALFLKGLQEGISLENFTETMKVHLPDIAGELNQRWINYSTLKQETADEYWKRIQPLIKKGLPKIFDPMATF